MSAATSSVVSQKRLATFLRLFKPKTCRISSDGGLIWAFHPIEGSPCLVAPAICIGEGDAKGAIEIDVKKYGKFIRSSGTNADIAATYDGKSLSLESDKLGSMEFEKDAKHVSEYAPLDERGEYLVTIPADVVKQMAGYADRTDSESRRYALSGFLVEQEHFIATDGRRLLVGKIDHLGAQEFAIGAKENKPGDELVPFSVNVPADLVRYAAMLGESIDVFQQRLIAGDVVAAPVDGRFPTWRQVLVETDTETPVDIDDMIQRCDKQLAISKINNGEEMGLELVMSHDDEEFKATFDCRYLAAAIKGRSAATINYASDGVQSKYNERCFESPIVVTNADEPNVQEVIMAISRNPKRK